MVFLWRWFLGVHPNNFKEACDTNSVCDMAPDRENAIGADDLGHFAGRVLFMPMCHSPVPPLHPKQAPAQNPSKFLYQYHRVIENLAGVVGFPVRFLSLFVSS